MNQDTIQSQHSAVRLELTKSLNVLKESLKQVQSLRCTVDQVFRFLNVGYSDDGSDDAQLHQQNFLQQLQNSLTTVNREFDDFKKTCESLPSSLPTNIPHLGNLAQLALDPSQDKVALFQQLQRSQKWWDRVQDHIYFNQLLLNRNNLKRSSYPHSHPQNKIQRPPNKGHHMQSDFINMVFQNILKLYGDLKFQPVNLYGNSRVLQVVVGKVMFVHIILRGLNIERVFVRGLDEEDGMDGLDLFTESQYSVMRMVTAHATAASLYYYHSNTYQNNPDTVIRMFLAWLRSYKTLFSDSCKRCGKYLNEGLPPTWRDYRNLAAYHYNCKD